jgi:hypothetical protein
MLILVRLVEQIEDLDGGQPYTRPRECSLEKPLMAPGWRCRPLHGRSKLHDRLAAPGNHHFLALQSAIDQLWQVVFGVCDAVGCHDEIFPRTWL